MNEKKTIKIGLLGAGVVGKGVIKLLTQNIESIQQTCYVKLQLKYITDKNPLAIETLEINKNIFTLDVYKVLEDPEIDIIIELIGGKEDAKVYVEKALQNQKCVITANKALLAEYWKYLFELANKNKVKIGFEGSVGGGIPIVALLLKNLAANQIESLYGIINGTCNYIFTKMKEENKDFFTALKEAQQKGYVEKNPALDIEGIDVTHKLLILASIAFKKEVKLEKIYTEGISQITVDDIKYVNELGYEVKLLAIAKKINQKLEVRVHPTLVPQECLLAKVKGVFNSIYLKGDAIGNMMFYGKGAGQMATASAVLSDVIEIAQAIAEKRPLRNEAMDFSQETIEIIDINNLTTSYYLRFITIDQPGVLSKISGILGKNEISIASVIQKENHRNEYVTIIMMTYQSKEKNLKNALAEIDALSIVKAKTLLIRIEKDI